MDERQVPGAPAPEQICGELSAGLEIAITNLELLSALDYYLIGHATPDALPDRGNLETANTQALILRQRMWSLLVQNYAEKPSELAVSLRGASAYALYRLAWGSLRIERKDTTGNPFDGWEQLAATMLQACDLEPNTMVKQVTAFVIRPTGRRVGPAMEQECVFDAIAAKTLFGNANQVLTHLNHPASVEALDQVSKEALQRALMERSNGVDFDSALRQYTPPGDS